MRYIKSLLILTATSLLALACRKEEDPSTTTAEPEAPVIENATLRGNGGETEIEVGNTVKFEAQVSVKGSTLEKFSLEIKKGTEIIGTAEFTLEGTSAKVEKTFDFPISAASLDEDFYPEVSMKVTNTDGLYTEERLARENNVKIKAQEIIEKLWLVDNTGHVWPMKQTAVKGNYRTEGSLAELGANFTIASKITSDNKVDADGKKWEFTKPESGEYALKWIGFDLFEEKLSKMLDHTEIFDFATMADDQGNKVYWNRPLVQDCRILFINYPDGALLQADRFADVEANTARYTGHTGEHFEVYYVPDTKWIIVKEQWTCTDALWITGNNASLPMSPFCETHPLNWFAAGAQVSYDAVSCVKTDEGKFCTLLYLKENFAIKAYSARAWANELDWASTTPETLLISPIEADPETGKTDGNYGNAGASFTEGLYMLNYDKASKNVSLVKWTKTELPALAAGTDDPEKK